MPRIERNAQVVWEGNVARGQGRITAASGAFGDLPYSVATRIGSPEGKTSPEELLAAAHGGCFTTSLAGELTSLGHPPERLELSCRIIMDEVEGQGHQIVGSQIQVAATVDGIDEETFQKGVALAHAGCPFSALLERASATVEIDARLF